MSAFFLSKQHCGASLLLDEIWKIYVSAYNLAGNQYYTHNVACE